MNLNELTAAFRQKFNTAPLLVRSPAINPRGLEIDSSMFKIKPMHTVLIVIILLLISLIYVKFW